MSDAARAEMARCLRAKPAAESAAARKLEQLLHRHLWSPEDAASSSGRCRPFAPGGLVSSSTAATHACLRAAGAAKWAADGLRDASNTTCGRRWQGTAEARCLLAGRDLLFVGNSVMRRQMYTLLDLMAGRAAHRLLANGSSIQLGSRSDGSGSDGGGSDGSGSDGGYSPEAIRRTRLWDLDGHAHGYHAAQLFTVDLHTGAHRFHLPHSELCGVGTTHANFNAGRARQWTQPSTELTGIATGTRTRGFAGDIATQGHELWSHGRRARVMCRAPRC